MDQYEIRIIRKRGGPVILADNQTSDFSAIRRAQMMAGDSDACEVWRGMECIYKRAPLSDLYTAH